MTVTTYVLAGTVHHVRMVVRQERLTHWSAVYRPEQLLGLNHEVLVLVHWDSLRHHPEALHFRELLDTRNANWREVTLQ